MKKARAGIFLSFAFIPAAVGFFALITPRAEAATANAATADPCAITADDVAAINTAAAQGLLAELAARRALLTRTITCARSNAEALQSQLNQLALVPKDAKTIQTQLSGKLDDAITFYNLELDKVDGAGIAGTQGVAREVLAWRSSDYEPLAAQVDNFSLWVSNQPLFNAANSRLSGMANLVGFLEQAGQNNDLQHDLAVAQASVQKANSENTTAENAFLQSLPPDQTLGLVKKSLNTLSTVYQNFFDLATTIQAVLPLGK